MYKLSEQLIDKHLSKIIREITLEVCEKCFDTFFKVACHKPDPNDTTIGTCYKFLGKLANDVVISHLETKMEKVTEEMGTVRRTIIDNPFAGLSYDLWDNFLEHYNTKGWVDSIISDHYQDKLIELQKNGILDAEGNYIKK